MLEFIKLYADMEQLFEPFTMEERGMLFTAMMAYAFSGEEPGFTGNERFLWPVLRRHIDQCNGRAEVLRENGAKGGRPKTKENPKKPNKTKETALVSEENPKETLQEQEQKHKQDNKQEQKDTAPAPEDAAVIGIDGSDLREEIARNQTADALIAAYRLNRDDPTREALIADLAQYGEPRMREALTEAAKSNVRERVSVNFWRAILRGKGRDSPKTGVGYGQVMTQRDYTEDYWKSIEVDVETD